MKPKDEYWRHKTNNVFVLKVLERTFNENGEHMKIQLLPTKQILFLRRDSVELEFCKMDGSELGIFLLSTVP